MKIVKIPRGIQIPSEFHQNLYGEVSTFHPFPFHLFDANFQTKPRDRGDLEARQKIELDEPKGISESEWQFHKLRVYKGFFIFKGEATVKNVSKFKQETPVQGIKSKDCE